MATKYNDPCHDKAKGDEPLFTLLARDISAPELVELWAFIREQRDGETDQTREAKMVATQMREWRLANKEK